MSNSLLKTYFTSINKILPSTGCVVVGSGSGSWIDILESLEISNVVLVEADSHQIKKMYKMHDVPDFYKIENALIYKDETSVAFHIATNPTVNCFKELESYKHIMPNIALVETKNSQSYALDTFLEKKKIQNINWLIIDTFTSLEILSHSESRLNEIDIVICKVFTAQTQYLSLFMQENGYRLIENFQESNPAISMNIYAKDFKVKNQNLEIKKNNLINTLKETSQKEKAELQAKLEKLQNEYTQQRSLVEQLTKEQEEISVKKTELEKNVENSKKELESTRVKENNLLNELEKQKSEFEKQLQEKNNFVNTLKEASQKEKSELQAKLEKLSHENAVLLKHEDQLRHSLEDLKAELKMSEEVNAKSKDELLKQAKVLEQQQKLLKQSEEASLKNELNLENTKYILNTIEPDLSSSKILLIAQAENALNRKDYNRSIVFWQKLASLYETTMPQLYFNRLKEAYMLSGGFPKASDEEEELRGSYDKHEFLAKLHDVLQPEFYLEVGVQTGKSLFLAKCKALGIDPMPLLSKELSINMEVLKLTSDDFFENYAEHVLTQTPDLVFIDGMHLFEYALRDFMHVERFSNENTVVVIDDIYPGHPAQSQRERRTRAWTGDVWKLLAILKAYRKELEITTLDIYPTGLMFIRGLDKNNRVLSENYETIKEEYMNKEIATDLYVERVGSVEPVEFLENLTKGRKI